MTFHKGPPPPHYLTRNHVARWPTKFICWDTEAHLAEREEGQEQTFRLAAAVSWARDLPEDKPLRMVRFTSPEDLWSWVSAECVKTGRTVAYAHNLSYDLQVCSMFTLLPAEGWRLAWFNLDHNATVVEWRRDQQTLVLCDSMTLWPMGLADVAGLVGDAKAPLPAENGSQEDWWARCEGDVTILATALRQWIAWARAEDLGNWHVSGSGQAWNYWRHTHLTEKILCRVNDDLLVTERAAVHTGRAEAWRTGGLPPGGLFDWDMRQAYCTIAAQVDVPIRWRCGGPGLTPHQYRAWREHFCVLSLCHVVTIKPIVPLQTADGWRWPVGEFDTWLWDPEIDLLLSEGAEVTLGESHSYLRAPALKSWADWTIGQLEPKTRTAPEIAIPWVKASSRSLIGRTGLRYRTWNPAKLNPLPGYVGLSKMGGPDIPTTELLHLGTQAFERGETEEADNSMPMIMGYVMSVSRVRLWLAMRAAGEGHVWHVDTDGLLVDKTGNTGLQAYAEANPDHRWLVKKRFWHGEIRGTRNFTLEGRHHISGVPRAAVQVEPNKWIGEQWQTVRQGLQQGHTDRVMVWTRPYRLTGKDNRREHLPNGSTRAFTA